MVAMTFSSASGTTVQSEIRRLQRGTAPVADEPRRHLESHQTEAWPGTRGRRTETLVMRTEKGDEVATDQAEIADWDRDDDLFEEAVRKRRAIAERLAALMAKVVAHRGQIAMAADVQLVKRELARAHAVLGESKSESNYLSVITLVEANLATMDWKNASAEQLRQVQQALTVGCAASAVTFDQYRRLERSFRGYGLPTIPTFDFCAENSGGTDYADFSDAE